jgi:hypothetical protein
MTLQPTNDITTLTHIIHGNMRPGPGIRSQPQENPIQASNSKLQRTDRHWKAGRPSGRLQGQLVGNVVVVVAEVPKGEVREEGHVDVAEGSTAARRQGERGGAFGGGGGGGEGHAALIDGIVAFGGEGGVHKGRLMGGGRADAVSRAAGV